MFSSTAREIRYTSIQVRTRSTDYEDGIALTLHVHDVLQSATPSTGSTYLDVRARQSHPVFLEQDDRGLYHWSDNFFVVYETT